LQAQQRAENQSLDEERVLSHVVDPQKKQRENSDPPTFELD